VPSRLITALAASTAILLPASVALAQRQPPPSPEQRIERLVRQLQQVQRQVFPKGRPADTAGFSDDPAATQSSVMSLDQRLDAVEKQMAELVRQSEENANRLRTMDTAIGQLRADQEQRLSAIEQRLAEAPAAAQAQPPETPAKPDATPAKPKPTAGKPPAPSKTSATTPPADAATVDSADASDPGGDAYTQGFRLWEAGQYDQAIASLKTFTAAYP
jgi:TolA-binding protein